MEELNDLVGYNLKIYQNKDWFKFSLESVLLPNFCTINPRTNRILDLCSGNCPIPLILSTRTNANIDAIEIQKEIYELGKKSIEYNKIDNINLILGDIRDYKKLFNHEYYDLITVNPPYFKNQIENNNVEKKTARHEDITLEEIIEAARYMLKNDGRLALVHRTERLVEILDILRKNNLEPKRLEFIYKDEESNSKLMMIEAIKSGKPGLILEKPLYTHDKNGDYRENIKEIFHR